MMNFKVDPKELNLVEMPFPADQDLDQAVLSVSSDVLRQSSSDNSHMTERVLLRKKDIKTEMQEEDASDNMITIRDPLDITKRSPSVRHSAFSEQALDQDELEVKWQALPRNNDAYEMGGDGYVFENGMFNFLASDNIINENGGVVHDHGGDGKRRQAWQNCQVSIKKNRKLDYVAQKLLANNILPKKVPDANDDKYEEEEPISIENNCDRQTNCNGRTVSLAQSTISCDTILFTDDHSSVDHIQLPVVSLKRLPENLLAQKKKEFFGDLVVYDHSDNEEEETIPFESTSVRISSPIDLPQSSLGCDSIFIKEEPVDHFQHPTGRLKKLPENSSDDEMVDSSMEIASLLPSVVSLNLSVIRRMFGGKIDGSHLSTSVKVASDENSGTVGDETSDRTDTRCKLGALPRRRSSVHKLIANSSSIFSEVTDANEIERIAKFKRRSSVGKNKSSSRGQDKENADSVRKLGHLATTSGLPAGKRQRIYFQNILALAEDSRSQEKRFTNDLTDTWRNKCDICGFITSPEAFRFHLKKRHNLRMADYVAQNGGKISFDNITYHRCFLCQKVLGLYSNLMTSHCRGIHGITFAEYRNKFETSQSAETIDPGFISATAVKDEILVEEEESHDYLSSIGVPMDITEDDLDPLLTSDVPLENNPSEDHEMLLTGDLSLDNGPDKHESPSIESSDVPRKWSSAKEFYCRVCSTSFGHGGQFAEHMVAEHQLDADGIHDDRWTDAIYKCKICGNGLLHSEHVLREHIDRVHYLNLNTYEDIYETAPQQISSGRSSIENRRNSIDDGKNMIKEGESAKEEGECAIEKERSSITDKRSSMDDLRTSAEDRRSSMEDDSLDARSSMQCARLESNDDSMTTRPDKIHDSILDDSQLNNGASGEGEKILERCNEQKASTEDDISGPNHRKDTSAIETKKSLNLPADRKLPATNVEKQTTGSLNSTEENGSRSSNSANDQQISDSNGRSQESSTSTLSADGEKLYRCPAENCQFATNFQGMKGGAASKHCILAHGLTPTMHRRLGLKWKKI